MGSENIIPRKKKSHLNLWGKEAPQKLEFHYYKKIVIKYAFTCMK